MNFTGAMQVLQWSIALAVVAATVVAFFRVNLAKTQIDLLKSENEIIKGKTSRLETDLLAEQVEKTSLKQEVATLRSIVTGKEQLNHLQRQLDAHDRRVDERHSIEMEVLSNILTVTQTNRDTTDKNRESIHELTDLVRTTK